MGDRVVGLGGQSPTARAQEILSQRTQDRVAERKRELEAQEADAQRRADAARAERTQAPRGQGALGRNVDTTA